jgi:hypothetical protein
MDKELERLEKLKLNSIENPGKPKKGCKTCKKPKEVKLDSLIILEDLDVYVPSIEDIKQAYVMLGNPKPEERLFIEKVFMGLFNKSFDWNCLSCVHTHTQILKNYLKDVGIKL